MKKILAGFIALSCLSGSLLTVNAEQSWLDNPTLESENFTYYGDDVCIITPTEESGITCDANFMITGSFRYDGSWTVTGEPTVWYTVACLTKGYGAWHGTLSALDLEAYLDNFDTLDVGDLLYINNVGVLESYPVQFYPSKEGDALNPDSSEELTVEYVGYGLDIYGSEFMKVMRHEAILDPVPYGFEKDDTNISQRLDIIMGDATEDENVDILDVITINKSILGKTTISSYAQYVADVNKNGVPDPADSLAVMKYIVGLTESPDAPET